MEGKPTHEQAQLHLQVYDQRREAKLRQARDWFAKNYIVNSIDEAMRIAPMGSETGTYVGMVIGYWEQACALLNYGLLHEDLFFETSGEFFGVWELAKAAVPQARELFKYNGYLSHLTTATQRNLGREPLPRPHRRHAPVHEADAASDCKSGLNVNPKVEIHGSKLQR